MANSLSASKKLMQSYLSELLTEEATPVEGINSLPREPEKKELESLLSRVSVTQSPLSEPLVSKKSLAPSIAEKDSELITQVPVLGSEKQVQKDDEASYRNGSFQAMFFDVAGLLVAVPLIELGGIHNVTKTTSLMGKPDWFKGVMVHREDKINIVDTALWIMPEKCDEELKNSLNYQYVIMLNNSNWGLMAETLVDTVTLEHEDVKWTGKNQTKRPWLAGLVKNRMCALLDVESLITLLEEGACVNSE